MTEHSFLNKSTNKSTFKFEITVEDVNICQEEHNMLKITGDSDTLPAQLMDNIVGTPSLL